MRAAVLLLAGCAGIAPVDAPIPPADVDLARAELGHALFFDPGLSADGTVACATCHRPDHGGAEPRATSIGLAEGRRNAPSVWSAALVSPLFWDGRAETLEEQATMPLLNADEMGADETTVVAYLADAYGDRWPAAFPEAPTPDLDGFAVAIADYERQLVAPGRVDAYLAGNRSALTDLEVRGYRSFVNQCAFCHNGEGVGGARLRLLGDEEPWPHRDDLGVAELTGDPRDEHVFRVPSLRYVASTPPYFHDGSIETLDEAVKLMGKHQLGEAFTDPEIAELVAFLEALDAAPEARWREAP